jgi:cobalt-zinc-cadmium resistance protein CzcA
VDGSVVLVENVFRHLSKRPAGGASGAGRLHTVRVAATEVGRPIAFGIFIIIAVFLPLFTLQGLEGKMFAPMAFTIAIALLGSLPALALSGPLLLVPSRGRDTWIMRGAKRICIPALERASGGEDSFSGWGSALSS